MAPQPDGNGDGHGNDSSDGDDGERDCESLVILHIGVRWGQPVATRHDARLAWTPSNRRAVGGSREDKASLSPGE